MRTPKRLSVRDLCRCAIMRPAGNPVGSLLGALARHAAVGLLLGVIVALYVVLSNVHGIYGIIINDATPALTMATFVSIFAFTISVGSTITGLMFELSEKD